MRVCVNATSDILINQVIKKALVVASEITQLEWVRSLLMSAIGYFDNIQDIDEISKDDFPKVSEFTSITRNDYDKALRFSKLFFF